MTKREELKGPPLCNWSPARNNSRLSPIASSTSPPSRCRLGPVRAGKPKEVRSQKGLGGRFCPYLPEQEIADVPLRAVWGRSGPESRKRYGARRAWESDFVRTCRSRKLPMCLRGPSEAGQSRKAGRGTEPEEPGRAILSVPAAGGRGGDDRMEDMK